MMDSHDNLKMVDSKVYRYPSDEPTVYEKSVAEVRCVNCDIEIATITGVDDVPVETNHIVVCPDCGEESFIIKTSGTYVYSYPEGSNIIPVDIDYRIDGKQHTSKLILKRK